MQHSKCLSQVFQVGFWCLKKWIWSTHLVDWEVDIKSLYLLNTRVVTCRAVGLCGFRNSLLVDSRWANCPPPSFPALWGLIRFQSSPRHWYSALKIMNILMFLTRTATLVLFHLLYLLFITQLSRANRRCYLKLLYDLLRLDNRVQKNGARYMI